MTFLRTEGADCDILLLSADREEQLKLANDAIVADLPKDVPSTAQDHLTDATRNSLFYIGRKVMITVHTVLYGIDVHKLHRAST